MTSPSPTNVNLQGVNLTSLPNSINGLQNVQVVNDNCLLNSQHWSKFINILFFVYTTGFIPGLIATYHHVIKRITDYRWHRYAYRSDRFSSYIVRHKYLHDDLER